MVYPCGGDKVSPIFARTQTLLNLLCGLVEQSQIAFLCIVANTIHYVLDIQNKNFHSWDGLF